MILLDTNVVSEVLRPTPSTAVIGWLSSQVQSALFTTAICQAEILSGIEILPIGRRGSDLSEGVDRIFREYFEGRVLPFDESAARTYAAIVAARRATGRPIDGLDAMIAAIALSNNAPLATRNTRDFAGCGVQLINPWAE
jgi:predicted nucleic acid-binding protein